MIFLYYRRMWKIQIVFLLGVGYNEKGVIFHKSKIVFMVKILYCGSSNSN